MTNKEREGGREDGGWAETHIHACGTFSVCTTTSKQKLKIVVVSPTYSQEYLGSITPELP